MISFLRALVNLSRSYKTLIMLGHDSVVVFFSIVMAVFLKGEMDLFAGDEMIVVVGIQVFGLSAFAAQRLYRSTVRYMGYKAMLSILQATTVLTVCFAVYVSFLSYQNFAVELDEKFWRFLAIFWLVLTFMLMGSRQTARWLLNTVSLSEDIRDYLVYGAGQGGRQAVAAMIGSKNTRVLGFLDDDPSLKGRLVNNYPVLGNIDYLETVRKVSKNLTVLLAAPTMEESRRLLLLNKLEEWSIAVRSLPPLDELVKGNATFEQIEPLRVEELLGREPVVLGSEFLQNVLGDKVILVTGAGGSIGSELCRQLLKLAPRKLILLDHSEFNLYLIQKEIGKFFDSSDVATEFEAVLGSVVDQKVLDRIFSTQEIYSIYHAAAYKHVPMVENNIIEGLKNNVIGTYNLIAMAKKYGVKKFVLISTDKAVRPTNVMGATKRLAELVVQGAAHRARANDKSWQIYTMVRFGNVLGSSGSVVPLFREQIRNGGPVTVTHPEVTRFFMTVSEAAQLVIEAVSSAVGGEVFVLDMGEPVKIDDLAKRMIRLSGFSVKSGEDQPDGHSIAINYTGLRPGEKLYEELILGDTLQPTSNAKVFQADEAFIVWSEVESMIEAVIKSIDNSDSDGLIKTLTHYVTDYSRSE